MDIFKDNNIRRCPFCGRKMKRFIPIVTIPDEEDFKSKVLSKIEHIINKERQETILETLDKVKHSGYYVKMAVAWAISLCFVKFEEKTMNYLKNNK